MLSWLTRTILPWKPACRMASAESPPAWPPPIIMTVSIRFSLITVNFHHCEVFFCRTTFWADPVIRDVLPAGTWWNVFFWKTLSFVVNEITEETLPLFHRCHLLILRLTTRYLIRSGRGGLYFKKHLR